MSRKGKFFRALGGKNIGTHMVIHKRKRRYKPVEAVKGKAIAESRAEELRQNATDAELYLKNALENKHIHFYFQYAHYNRGKIAIVDFVFPRANKENRLYVEIDGGYHLTDKQKEKDSKRSIWLNEHTGAEILRFTNEQVLSDVEYVIEKLISKRVQFMT